MSSSSADGSPTRMATGSTPKTAEPFAWRSRLAVRDRLFFQPLSLLVCITGAWNSPHKIPAKGRVERLIWLRKSHRRKSPARLPKLFKMVGPVPGLRASLEVPSLKERSLHPRRSNNVLDVPRRLFSWAFLLLVIESPPCLADGALEIILL